MLSNRAMRCCSLLCVPGDCGVVGGDAVALPLAMEACCCCWLAGV